MEKLRHSGSWRLGTDLGRTLPGIQTRKGGGLPWRNTWSDERARGTTPTSLGCRPNAGPAVERGAEVVCWPVYRVRSQPRMCFARYQRSARTAHCASAREQSPASTRRGPSRVARLGRRSSRLAKVHRCRNETHPHPIVGNRLYQNSSAPPRHRLKSEAKNRDAELPAGVAAVSGLCRGSALREDAACPRPRSW